MLNNVITFQPHGISETNAVIGKIGNDSGRYEHLSFSIFDAMNIPGGSPGACRIQLKFFESNPSSDVSVSVATMPVIIIFIRGLEHEAVSAGLILVAIPFL